MLNMPVHHPPGHYKKYLASGMIKGIGPVLAGRIVNAYEERTAFRGQRFRKGG